MTHYRQKKIAVINDLSGYGRCSLTVALPIISAMRVQACPVPTSILSNHTGFSTYFFDDYTPKLKPYLEQWEKLDLEFDGILTGFLGSEEQISMVSDMIRRFKKQHTTVIIDPIMGDHGKPYQTYTPGMCRKMSLLAGCGDILTPNLTEACILTETPFKEDGWTRRELRRMVSLLHGLGPGAVVVTGVPEGGWLTNVISQKGEEPRFQRLRQAGRERHGTGDVFSSVLAAAVVGGLSLEAAVKKAAVFVKKCIVESDERNVPLENGVCFEELLSLLVK